MTPENIKAVGELVIEQAKIAVGSDDPSALVAALAGMAVGALLEIDRLEQSIAHMSHGHGRVGWPRDSNGIPMPANGPKAERTAL